MANGEDLERLILEYLRTTPRAGDTLEGIARWWILRQRIAESLEQVRHALTNLVAAGFVLERRLPDGEVYYGLHRDHGGPP